MILFRAWLSAVAYSESAKFSSVFFSDLVREIDCNNNIGSGN